MCPRLTIYQGRINQENYSKHFYSERGETGNTKQTVGSNSEILSRRHFEGLKPRDGEYSLIYPQFFSLRVAYLSTISKFQYMCDLSIPFSPWLCVR